MIALLHTHCGVPAVVLYLSEEFIVFHHPCTARLVMLQMYEATITELLTPARQVLRDDMGMNIYFE